MHSLSILQARAHFVCVSEIQCVNFERLTGLSTTCVAWRSIVGHQTTAIALSLRRRKLACAATSQKACIATVSRSRYAYYEESKWMSKAVTSSERTSITVAFCKLSFKGSLLVLVLVIAGIRATRDQLLGAEPRQTHQNTRNIKFTRLEGAKRLCRSPTRTAAVRRTCQIQNAVIRC
eukprot:6212879-Pleurochrysis_carterae.AAC.1